MRTGAARPSKEPKLSKWPDCAKCGKPVSMAGGGLGINRSRSSRRQIGIDRWSEEQRDEDGVELLSPDGPEPEPWVIGHSACYPDADYWIDAGRFDTLGKALSWTLHLSEKVWLNWMAWETAVRRIHRVPGL